MDISQTSLTIINSAIAGLNSQDTELISDGFHTFKELYEFRLLYNAAWFNSLKDQGIEIYKSRKHSDGEPCFDGNWFIVIAELPTGQISNHYLNEYWDYFKISERDLPNLYDGHTPQDVLERIKKFIFLENKISWVN